MFLTFLLIVVIYSGLIYKYYIGFVRYNEFIPKESSQDFYPISIIIPIRTSGNISALQSLINDLSNQLKDTIYELIVIDDFSTSPFHIEQACCTIYSLTAARKDLNAFKNNKKEAIELGIETSKYEFIVCLDADISLSPQWAYTILSFLVQHKPKFAAGVHRYHFKISFFNKFLELEQDNNTAISIGSLYHNSPTMCNGANMVFDKSAFIALGGYSGLYHINGGDDMLLYHRMHQKYPKETFYIKNLNGAVFSEPPENLSALATQRNRWLSKSLEYENLWVPFQLFIVFLANFIIALLGFRLDRYTFILLGIKWVVDGLFIYSQRTFFTSKLSIWELLIMVLIYPYYVMWISINALMHKVKGI